MIKNLLEYIVTDVYTQLAIVSEITQRDPGRTHWHDFNIDDKDGTFTRRWNECYDLDELHQGTIEKLPVDDVPVKLKAEFSYRFNDGKFHTKSQSDPSICVKEMELTFPEELPNYGRRKGPNIVRLTDVMKYHRRGKLVSLTCKNAKFTWTIDGVSRRESGPYLMEYQNVDFKVSEEDGKSSTLVNIKKIHTEWKKSKSSRTIIMKDALEALNSNYVDYDMYSATDFFRDPLDEMSFLNSVT